MRINILRRRARIKDTAVRVLFQFFQNIAAVTFYRCFKGFKNHLENLVFPIHLFDKESMTALFIYRPVCIIYRSASILYIPVGIRNFPQKNTTF